MKDREKEFPGLWPFGERNGCFRFVICIVGGNFAGNHIPPLKRNIKEFFSQIDFFSTTVFWMRRKQRKWK